MNTPLPNPAEQPEPLEQAQTEQLLGRFAPRPSRIDRDRLMYLAGQAAAEPVAATGLDHVRTPWYWPAATLVSSAAAVGLAALLVLQGAADRSARPARGPAISESSPRVPAEPPTTNSRDVQKSPPTRGLAIDDSYPTPQLADDSLLRMRGKVLRDGVDSVPIPETTRADRENLTTYGRTLRNLAQGPRTLSWYGQ